jgi:hypothetical protein
VLVQRLARANAEHETAFCHDLGRGRSLGDDRRMKPERRARDASGDLVPGCRGDASDDAPDEWALSLALDPGMEVIGDEHGRESGFFTYLCLIDKVAGTVFLARQK